MGDAADFEKRIHDAWMNITVGLAECSLGLEEICADNAFENYLGGGRHFQIDGLAFNQRDGLPRQSSRHGELIDTVGDLLHGGVSHDGRPAHDQSGFQMFAAGNRLPPVNIQLLVGLRARTDPGLSSSFYLRSVVAYIANSGVEIFGHPLGASKIGSVVKARRRNGNCNFVEALHRVRRPCALLLAPVHSRPESVRWGEPARVATFARSLPERSPCPSRIPSAMPQVLRTILIRHTCGAHRPRSQTGTPSAPLRECHRKIASGRWDGSLCPCWSAV